MKKNDRMLYKNEYIRSLEELMRDPRILQMANYSQHGDGNTFAHSVHVARVAGKIAGSLQLRIRSRDLARGAMLHDFYLYTAPHNGNPKEAYLHGTCHCLTALENAAQYFDLTEVEKNIIYSHMWPLNLTHIPRCRESVLIIIADKYCATAEFFGSAQRGIRRFFKRPAADMS